MAVDLIQLGSPDGQRLLTTCMSKENGSVFQPYIHATFSKQTGRYNCGIQSSAIVLSAQQLALNNPRKSAVTPIPKADHPITEESMFEYEATTKVISPAEIDRNGGCTLQQMAAILKNHGRNVNLMFAATADDVGDVAAAATTDRFRQDAKTALGAAESESYVIVNYHMGSLGHSPPHGHHSPLAGYHAETDRFLVMDTGVNAEFWVRSEDLFRAMATVDKISNKARGYCVVTRSE